MTFYFLSGFQCLGGWKENGTNYLIVASADDEVDLCLSYFKSGPESYRMTLSTFNCHPKVIHHYHHHHYSDSKLVSVSLNQNDNRGSPNPQSNGLARRHHSIESIKFDLVQKGKDS